MDTFFTLTCFLFGLIIGSFLNVVILRLPDPDQSIAFPGSHCPACQTPLHWFENIPVLSYLVLRGRCRSCHRPISSQYPLVELAMAILLAALYRRWGLTPPLFFYGLFCAALLVIIVIDIHHQIIPDVISLPGILIGLACSPLNPAVSGLQSLLGILLGGGILYGVAAGYGLLTGRAGMGGGDIKLLAMIGAFLGVQSLLFVILASSISGSLVGIGAMIVQKKGGQTKIPFGPFLSLGALAWLFFQDQILMAWDLYLAVASGQG